jgi:hypothetical protein
MTAIRLDEDVRLSRQDAARPTARRVPVRRHPAGLAVANGATQSDATDLPAGGKPLPRRPVVAYIAGQPYTIAWSGKAIDAAVTAAAQAHGPARKRPP